MKSMDQARTLLSSPKKVVILTHKDPDGDAVGSSLAWGLMLQSLGHNVEVILPNAAAHNLNWIPGQELITVFESDPEKVKQSLLGAEVLFCLDFNRTDRLKWSLKEMVDPLSCPKILLDHHLEPAPFDYGISRVSATSTGEIVFDVIEEWGLVAKITPEIADGLYTAIMTDTGSFRYRGTSARVHEIVAVLIRAGARNAEIHELLYAQESVGRLQFIGFALNQKLRIWDDMGVAVMIFSRTEMEPFGLRPGDTEGVVNIPLDVKEVQLSIFAREEKDYIKLSFRSKGELACNEIAKKYFNGGGHKNAAGGSYHGSLQSLEGFLRNSLQESLK